MKKYIALLCALGMSACTQPVPTVSLPDAIQVVEKELSASALNVAADPSEWSADQETKFLNSIKTYQCLSKEADPIVPYMQSTTSLTLIGSYTQNMGFEVGASTVAPTKFTSNGSSVRGNNLNVTIDFAPVDMLPALVYQQQKKRIVGLETQIHQDNLGSKSTEADHLLLEHSILQEIVNSAIASYSAQQCVIYKLDNDQFYTGAKRK